jgi:predicted Mrr-cat superfamily restriction endonuclease
MVDRIHRIVAGNPDADQDAYAQEFLRDRGNGEGVVAIGWGETGDITNMNEQQLAEACKGFDNPSEAKNVLLRFRDRIGNNEPVIAYKSPNTIVAVGRIRSDYFFDDKDNLGSPGGLHYPHMRRVFWRGKPRMFNRNLLPDDFAPSVAIPGTFKTLEYDFDLIEAELDRIPDEIQQEKVVRAEDEEQMRLYFKSNIKELEPGLVALNERDTSVGEADILCKEGDAWVVIEVKKTASDSAAGQLLGYMAAIKEDKNAAKVRGIVAAEDVTDRLVKALSFAKSHGMDLSIYRCRLKFEPSKVL